MKLWAVIYNVKYSELWCADECDWIEHVERVEAETPRKAQMAFREAVKALRFCIVGRHVVTREVRGKVGAS